MSLVDQADRILMDNKGTAAPPLSATSRGQYALIDAGRRRHLRYLWVEHMGGSTRTMAGFYLATDAIELHSYYQRREDAEAIRFGVQS